MFGPNCHMTLRNSRSRRRETRKGFSLFCFPTTLFQNTLFFLYLLTQIDRQIGAKELEIFIDNGESRGGLEYDLLLKVLLFGGLVSPALPDADN